MQKILLLLTLGLLTTIASPFDVAAAEPAKDNQTLIRAGSQASVKGSNQFFTGTVRIDPLWAPKHPDAPFSGGLVTFEPGARSFWHTHPTGQHLVVMSGVGLTGVWSGKVQEFRAGDVLWCPAGVKHWHGASPTTAMTHLAVTGTLPDGNNVKWMEEVTDEQYKTR